LLRPPGLPIRSDGIPFASVRMLPQPLEEGLAQRIHLPLLAKDYALTRSEQDVVLGIVQGQSNHEMASSLGTDEETIRYHIDSVYAKTGFRSRVDLVFGLSSLGIDSPGRGAQMGHETNTPNHVIALNASLLETTLRKVKEARLRAREDEVPETLDEDKELSAAEPLVRGIIKASGQIHQVVTDLHGGIQHQKRPVLVDLAQLVQQTAQLYQIRSGQDTSRLVVQVPQGPVAVLGVEFRLQQLIVNLVTNALHALENPNQAVCLMVEVCQGSAELSVADEGQGMSPEVQAQLGVPFFTTRKRQGGSGLGWGVCQEIVREHSGTLEVQSQLGVGTTVSVRFPSVSAVCSAPED